MSSKVTGSRFEILNTSQSLVTGLLNKRARANITTTKKEAKSQWEKEIRSRSPSDSSLTVCKFCFFLSSSSLLSDQPAVWFHSVHFLSWGTHHSFFSASYASGIIGSQIRGTPPSTSHGKRFDAPEFLALPLDGRVPHSGEKEDRELFFFKR